MRRVFHLLVICLALGFMAFMVLSQWQQLITFDWDARIDLLLISILALIVIFVLDAMGWYFILRALDQRIPVRISIFIWMLSSLTRYLPGAVWSYLSRVSLTSGHGIKVAPSVFSLYLETLLLVTTAFLVGLPALLLAADVTTPLPTLFFTFILFSGLLHPRIIALLHYIPGNIGNIFRQFALPDAKRILALYCYYICFWLLFSGVFALFANSVHPLSAEQWLPVGLCMPLAFAAGFILVIFPGGIGIREATLYFLLLPILPEPVALMVSLGSRAWIMCGEFLALGLTWLLRRKMAVNMLMG